MRVEQLGRGEPSVAVVGGIHGDEPCGVAAIERLLAEDPDVEAPVKLVVANERAVERGVRFIDTDLNRAFPGNPDSERHEERLAAALAEELDGCLTLALHSTQSHAEPFAVVDRADDVARAVCSRLSVEAVIDTSEFIQGRLFAAVRTIEVECGLQGSDAATENAVRLVREFLAATGVLSEEAGVKTKPRSIPQYRLVRSVPKREADEYRVFPANFERVPAGEVFASAGETELIAEEEFYPVLMSPYGYDSIFGYAAEYVGELKPSSAAVLEDLSSSATN